MKKLFAIFPLAALMFACGNPRPVEAVEPAAEVVCEEVIVVEEVEAVVAPTPPAAPAPRPAAPAPTPAPTPTPEPEPTPEPTVEERVQERVQDARRGDGRR